MAEAAFAALSIAANIAQFTEYALALVSDCREIYDSVEGAKQETLELEVVVQSIGQRHEQVQKVCAGARSSAVSENLLRLIEACEPSINKLIKTVEKIKASKSSRFPKLTSLRAGIKASYYGKTLNDLKTRLLAIEEEISREMVRVLSDEQSEVARAMRHLQDSYKWRELKFDNQLGRLKTDLVEHATMILNSQLESKANIVTELIAKIEHLLQEAKEMELDQRFIRSLGFEAFEEREYNIKHANKRTLDWVFQKEPVNFSEWLESKNGIYWVEGKAGSGKSTLMKHICRHDTTTRALQKWAGNDTLVTARFFFWNSGLPMQRSQMGLLQSLLYQILSTSQPLMRLVRPERLPSHWGVERLYEMLHKIVSEGETMIKYCFFIDGLDEYEGDADDIVAAVKALGSLPTVKLCVSSRPWGEFIKAFSRDGYKLVLQDLTMQDMVNYAIDEFMKDDIFASLAEDNPRFHELPAMVAKKAEGVWLWSFLVVRNLLRELTRRTTFQDMLDRFNSLPGELEGYYERILAKLKPVDRIEADQIFLIAIHAVTPLPAIALQWVTLFQKDNWHTVSTDFDESCSDEVYHDLRTFLGNRCGDLLEVNLNKTLEKIPALRYKVDFLHRTVRDFLTSSYQQTLRQRVPPEFDSNRTLSRIAITMLKTIKDGLSSEGQEREILFSFVDGFLHYARGLELTNNLEIELVDEFDQVVAEHLPDCGDHWTDERVASELERCTFIARVIEAKLGSYIAAKFEENCNLVHQKRGRPLLDYALRPRFAVDGMSSQFERYNEAIAVDSGILKILLDNGASPNERMPSWQEFNGSLPTIWSLFLKFCYDYRRRASPSVVQSWYRAAELLVSHNASPHVKVAIPLSGNRRGVHEKSVTEILAKVFPSFQSRPLVQRLVDAHHKKREQSWRSWFRWGSSVDEWEKVQWQRLNESSRARS